MLEEVSAVVVACLRVSRSGSRYGVADGGCTSVGCIRLVKVHQRSDGNHLQPSKYRVA